MLRIISSRPRDARLVLAPLLRELLLQLLDAAARLVVVEEAGEGRRGGERQRAGEEKPRGAAIHPDT
jgi:hypothetical protein